MAESPKDGRYAVPSAKFRLRSFVSWATGVCFLAAALSGVIIFAAPAFSNGEAVHVLGLAVREWSDVHIVTGFLCVLLIALHLFLNIRPFLAYVKRARNGMTARREALVAVLMVLLVVLGAAAGVEPFASLASLGESLKGSIAQREENNAQAAERDERNPAAATPAHVVPSAPPPSDKYDREVDCQGREGCGRGFETGKMTLEQFCSRFDIDIDSALRKLKKKGITATPKSRIRFIADDLGVIPIALVRILKH